MQYYLNAGSNLTLVSSLRVSLRPIPDAWKCTCSALGSHPLTFSHQSISNGRACVYPPSFRRCCLCWRLLTWSLLAWMGILSQRALGKSNTFQCVNASAVKDKCLQPTLFQSSAQAQQPASVPPPVGRTKAQKTNAFLFIPKGDFYRMSVCDILLTGWRPAVRRRRDSRDERGYDTPAAPRDTEHQNHRPWVLARRGHSSVAASELC